jgi:carbon-monoxide dehydrogenase large subunit
MSSPSAEPGRYGSGHAVPRIEDAALLAGRGRFVDNVADAGAAQVVFVRSPVAHARIVAIDVDAARAAPGVLAVFTGADLVAAGVKPIATTADFKRPDGKPLASPARRALAHEVVRHVGEAVVAIVAASRAAARDATEAVQVDYDDLPAVAHAVAATTPGAAVVHADAPDNIAAHVRSGDAAATAAAFERAAHVVALDLVNQRLAPSPMEPRSVQAGWDDAEGRLVVRISSQMPTGVLGTLVDCLPGLRREQVRVVVGDVGGGFGMKTGAYPEDIVVAHAARALRRAVRWQAERNEDFVSASHGRDLTSHAELALDADGRALALRVRSLANVGAYATATGVFIQLLVGPFVTTSVYDIGAIDLQASAVLTNTMPVGAYRGAGRPEAIYLIERLMDAAARELDLDPAELRRRNLVRPEQMPYRNAMGQTYDCGRFEQMLDQGLALADWGGYAARRADSQRRGKLRGRSVATFLEWTSGGVFDERVGITIGADGIIEVFSATQAMGQGIATSYAQLVVDVFGVPIERVRILQGDTDRGQGFGSAGSRSLFVGGSAVRVASERSVEHGKSLAADALEVAPPDIEYRAGRYTVAGTDRSIGLGELAARQPGARIEVELANSVGGVTWPNACHVAEVEIDPETGQVDVMSYASVNDIGRVVNPTIATGQVEGGAVQGIGQALGEQVVYDAHTAQLMTASFSDYAMPRAADTPLLWRTQFDTSVPTALNPLGAKGVGELGTIGATPVVVNAVIAALASAGVGRDVAERLQMPLTAEKVWRAVALREGGAVVAAPEHLMHRPFG